MILGRMLEQCALHQESTTSVGMFCDRVARRVHLARHGRARCTHLAARTRASRIPLRGAVTPLFATRPAATNQPAIQPAGQPALCWFLVGVLLVFCWFFVGLLLVVVLIVGWFFVGLLLVFCWFVVGFLLVFCCFFVVSFVIFLLVFCWFVVGCLLVFCCFFVVFLLVFLLVFC